MIERNDIAETLKMIEHDHLDIRTVTIGVSLLGCASSDGKMFAGKIYDKITKTAERLVPVCNEIEKTYGIPIINKRVSVTPIAIAGASLTKSEDFVLAAKAMDRAAHAVGINFIGGYSALVQEGATDGDKRFLRSIPDALTETEIVCSSVNVGSTKAGINMDAVRMMGGIVREAAEKTADNNCMACAKLVIFCNAPDDNPFMAGAFHGVGEGESVINVGVSGPGVVCSAIKAMPDASITEISETVKRSAFKITRVGQLVAKEASRRLGIPFGIVDLSLAPTPAIGDSVARTLEAMGLETCGCCGTTAALALLNDAVKKGGVMASSSVGGLSGAFIPVSEDEGMIEAAKSGCLTIEKLEAMTAVCSVGLDMIAVPGDTSAAVISAMIADEAAIGMINGKTTAVRVIPAIGKNVGDMISFGGLLGDAPIMKVNTASPEKFISRGGKIPAPIHSLKN